MDAPPVQYVRAADGWSVAFGSRGAGLPLIHAPILMNHFSRQWSSEMRGPLLDGLSERFQLFVYDSRGQGSSTRGLNEALTVDDLVLDLEAVASHVQSQRFVLFGPSSFGLVAVKYALRHEDRIEALVLWNYIDSSLAAFASPLRAMASADWEYFLEVTAKSGFPTRDPALTVQVFRETTTQQDLVILSTTLRSESASELLPHLSVPTLVLASRASDRAGPSEEAGRNTASLVKGAHLKIVEGASGGLDPVEGGGPPPVVLAIDDFVRALRHADAKRPEGLSSRELEVLRLIAAGRSNAQIAEALVISPNTVGRHVSNIFDKIGAANRAEATAYAMRNGLA